MYCYLFISIFNKITDNGAHQQIFNIYKSFKSIGIDCKIIIENVKNNNISFFNHCADSIRKFIGEPELDIEMLKEDLSTNQFELCSSVFFITYLPKNIQFIKYLHSVLNINLYYLISANYINLFQEYIVSNEKKITNVKNNIKQGFSKNIPKCIKLLTFHMFSEQKDALEIYYGRKINFIPHCWAPCKQIRQMSRLGMLRKTQSEMTPREGNNNGVVPDSYEFIIMEPNLSITKNCMYPILIAKLINPNSKIHVCCSNNHIKNKLLNMFPDVFLIFHERVSVCSFIQSFFQENKLPIVISHQIYNQNNYLYYEIMYMGLPLIHNAIKFSSYGIYYNTKKMKIIKKKFNIWQKNNFEIDTHSRKAILKSINPENVKNTNLITTIFSN